MNPIILKLKAFVGGPWLHDAVLKKKKKKKKEKKSSPQKSLVLSKPIVSTEKKKKKQITSTEKPRSDLTNQIYRKASFWLILWEMENFTVHFCEPRVKES